MVQYFPLFNIFINDLFEELDKSNTDPVTINNTDHLSALMFADDLILINNKRRTTKIFKCFR